MTLSPLFRKKNQVHKPSLKNVSQSKTYTSKNGLFFRIKKALVRFGKLSLRNVLLSKLFHRLFKLFFVVLFTWVVLYGFYTYMNNSFGNDIVVSKSEIIARVGKLTTLPNGVPDAVVRVEDSEALKRQNVFYENVKAGDYILIYPKMAIIYDLFKNEIVSIKRVEQ